MKKMLLQQIWVVECFIRPLTTFSVLYNLALDVFLPQLRRRPRHHPYIPSICSPADGFSLCPSAHILRMGSGDEVESCEGRFAVRLLDEAFSTMESMISQGDWSSLESRILQTF